MMKRGREDDKVMGPLFPRLHVNDADRGGPRAPPRNKMALYEQLSIPSQRFSSGTASMLPRQPHYAGGLVPSAPSSQGCGRERSVLSPFYVPSHVPAHGMEKVHNLSQEGLNANPVRIGLEKKSLHLSQRTVSTLGNEQAAAGCSSLQPHGLSSAKESSGKKLENEDDFMVPTFVQPRIALHSEKDLHSLDMEIRTHFHLDSPQKIGITTLKSPTQAQSSDGKPLKQHSTTISMSRQQERGNSEGKAKQMIKSTEGVSHLATRGKDGTEGMPHLPTRGKDGEPSNLSKTSSNNKCRCGKSNELDNSHCGSASLHRESAGTFGGPSMEKQDMLNGKDGSNSRMSLGNSPRGHYVAKNGSTTSEDKAAETGENADRNASSGGADGVRFSGDAIKHDSLGDVDGNDDTSETSMVDSVSGIGISPDDVVGIIGPKHFWKARRAIINQQRVFALQVFELHRLIKVQKLISASPHLLLEDTSYSCGTPAKASVKDAAVNPLMKCQHHTNKDESYKDNSNSTHPKENMVGIPLMSREDNNSKGPECHLQRNGSFSGNQNASPAPATSDIKPGSWGFHLPGNQWLVPVMSPTEGLIYKPYTGPCPPTAAFMAPIYGGGSAMSVPSNAGGFMSPAYGVPASHQQQSMGVLPGSAVAPNFFPAPYGLPVANPLVSGTAVEQVCSLAGPQPSGQNEQHSRSSCNISNTKSRALSECARNVVTAKDSDIQGSTASSPCDSGRQGRDVLSLFPMASAVEYPGLPPQTYCRDHQSHVIKVVPHNPRSATESAARIFQSIQKERQQYDSV